MQPSPQPSLPNPMSAHLLELLRRARRSASYLHSGSASRSFPSLSSRRSSSYSIFFVRPGASHPSHRPYQRRTPSTPERTQGKGAATVPTCTAGESGLVGRRSTNTPVICKAVDDERAVGGPRRGTGCYPPSARGPVGRWLRRGDAGGTARAGPELQYRRRRVASAGGLDPPTSLCSSRSWHARLLDRSSESSNRDHRSGLAKSSGGHTRSSGEWAQRHMSLGEAT